ncbi:MAG TPA: hypothetical protein DCY94_03170, partial [Firmicutes bacterium]|nr:hypothetical protein [Bacillota bacterium]
MNIVLKDIKGVGPKTLELLNRLGIFDIQDLLDYYPFRYDILKPTDLISGNVVVTGIVETTPITTYIKKSLNKLSFRIETNDSLVNIVIFNRAFMKNNLRRGTSITVIGEYDEKRNTITASNILFKEIDREYIEPVYHTTKGISSKLISNIVKNALSTDPVIEDYIPDYLVEKYDFKNKVDSIFEVHNPVNIGHMDKSLDRLKYEELFRFMFKINYLKSCRVDDDGLKRTIDESKIEDFISSLPFNLTPDQL